MFHIVSGIHSLLAVTNNSVALCSTIQCTALYVRVTSRLDY